MPLSLDPICSNDAANEESESSFLFSLQSTDDDERERQLSEPLLLESSITFPFMSTPEASQQDEQREDQEEEDDKPSDAGLLFFKTVYFFRGLSATTWGQFGVIYYNQALHLSNQKIGILQSVWPLLGVIFMPFWGYMADIIQSRKRIFLLCKILSTLSLLALSFHKMHSFPLVLLCVSGTSVFRASDFLDTHTIDFLGPKHRSTYGSIRLYTQLSWGLGAVIMGCLTDMFGFEINFWLFGIMMTSEVLLTAVGLPARSTSEQERYDRLANISNNENDGETTNARPDARLIFRVLCRIPVLRWLIQLAVIGASMSLVDSFLFIMLQNGLGASTRLCGYTVGITVLMGLPIFHYSKWFLKHWGHDVLIMVAMISYVIRVWGYSILTRSTVQWVLLLELFHGITFACMWITSVDFSAAVTPAEWSTTVPMTMQCLGGGIGPLIGGYVFDKYGAVTMYRGAGYVVGCVLVIHLATWLLCRQGHEAFLRKEAAANISDGSDGATRDEGSSSRSEEMGVESQARTL